MALELGERPQAQRLRSAARWLRKIGLGRLPGDFTVRVGGRQVFVPLASSLVLSAIAAGISLWL